MNYNDLLSLLENIEKDADLLTSIFMAIGIENINDIRRELNPSQIKLTINERLRVLSAINIYELLNKGFILELDTISSILKTDGTLDFIMDNLCNESDKIYYSIKMLINVNGNMQCFTKKCIEWADAFIINTYEVYSSKIHDVKMRIRAFDKRLLDSMNGGNISAVDFTNLRQYEDRITKIKLCVIEKYL